MTDSQIIKKALKWFNYYEIDAEEDNNIYVTVHSDQDIEYFVQI